MDENILKIKVKMFDCTVILNFRKISDETNFRLNINRENAEIYINLKTLYPENNLSTFIETANKFKTDFSQNYSYIIKSCDINVETEDTKWDYYTFHCITTSLYGGDHLYLVADSDYYNEIFELSDI
jgi:hypothetical protein